MRLTFPADIEERFEVAYARGSYAPSLAVLDCKIEIPVYTLSEGNYRFVLEESIPAVLVPYITKKSRGSNHPLLKSRKSTFWLYDIDRWLNAVGVEVAEVTPMLYIDE